VQSTIDFSGRSTQTKANRAGHLSNALSATRQDEGTITSVNDSHSKKARLPIDFTDEGIVNEASEPHR
jgi:hypothetical protein